MRMFKHSPVFRIGGDEFDPNTDTDYNKVFERADYKMFTRKNQLKAMQKR